jgi:putative DNA primase/helicase
MSGQLHHDARLLGGAVSGGQIRCPGPGHSKNDRSLCLRPSARSQIGYVFKSFAEDDPLECLDHIRACLGLPEFTPCARREPQGGDSRVSMAPLPPQGRPLSAVERMPGYLDTPDNSAAANKIWNEARAIRGSLAERYLLKERGLRLDSELDWMRVLRFHPSRILVALMRDSLTDEPKAIHRTYLSADGKKIGRKMLGPAKGCAIKLDRLGTSTTLSIGEGLESTLSGRAMGFFPAWCVGSAGAIAAFPVIPGVRQLRIFAEADEANEAALRHCADRWHEAGRAVQAIRPASGGDLNDEWLAFSDLPFEDRAADFLETCQRFWPGAALCQK